jgi:hypothetical protein
MQFKWSISPPHQFLNLLPGTYSRHTRRGGVFGAVIASHRLAATLVCRIRRTRAREVFLGCLHDALGPLIALVNPVPVLSHSGVCFFFTGCTVSFSGCHVKCGNIVIILNNIKFCFIVGSIG